MSATKTNHRPRHGTYYYAGRWRYTYARYHSRLTDDAKRLLTCTHWHHSETQARECGQRYLRALQTGTAESPIFLTNITRPRRRRSVATSPTSRGPIAGLTPLVWAQMLLDHDYRCAYCNRQLPPESLEREHANPYARGGPHHVTNIVPACLSCNREKGTLTDTKYRKLRADRDAYNRGVGQAEIDQRPQRAGARPEVIDVIRRLTNESGSATFTSAQVVAAMKDRASGYPDATVRATLSQMHTRPGMRPDASLRVRIEQVSHGVYRIAHDESVYDAMQDRPAEQ